ncbi:MAG: NAD(+)/NADH kinase [Burkholderiales bacterium]|nr:NAD(+)/NADH kinase [Burkholderiales bacterium]
MACGLIAAMAAPARFPRVALVGRYGSPALAAPLAELADFLTARGHSVVIDEGTPLPAVDSAPAADLARHADLAVVVGGDGTMLALARRVAPFDVPLIGINQGRLGFLTDIPLAHMTATLTAMLEGRYLEQRRTLLAVAIEHTDGKREEALALNDAVVNRGSLGTMIDCAVAIDGRFAYALRADGVIVATPTGSTAYALSAGGPILAPQLKSFLLVPVAPHALTHRPIAISDECSIAIRVTQGLDAGVHCDGQDHYTLAPGDCVTVRRAAFHARFLYPEGHDYFAALREKLHWSATPERITPPGAAS